MTLVQNEQKQHLRLLDTQTPQELNRILDNVKSGRIQESNKEETTAMTQAVAKLLLDTRKLQCTEKDFLMQVKKQTGLKDEVVEALWGAHSSESCLDDLITSDEYKFRDLEWRLEAKVASRFLHSVPPEPKIVMKIHLDRETSLKHRTTLPESSPESSKKELVMETDANSLVHIIDQLESARSAINIKRAAHFPS